MHFRHFLSALWGQNETSSGQNLLSEKGLGQTAKEPNVDERSEPNHTNTGSGHNSDTIETQRQAELLLKILKAWPNLSDEVQGRILTLIRQ